MYCRPSMHVGHRRAADLRRHQDFADLLAGLLVVRAEHRAARASRRRGHLRIAGDDQRLGDHQADAAALAGLRDVDALSIGWLRTASGVSPCGTWNFSVPVFRSIAVSTPYGGFTIDRPSRPCVSAPRPSPTRRRRCSATPRPPAGAPRPGPRRVRPAAPRPPPAPPAAAQAVVRLALPTAGCGRFGLRLTCVPDALCSNSSSLCFADGDVGVCSPAYRRCRFRDRTRARPVHAAARVADVDRAEQLGCSAPTGGMNGVCSQRIPLQVLERLRAQRRREVDQVVRRRRRCASTAAAWSESAASARSSRPACPSAEPASPAIGQIGWPVMRSNV